VPESYEEEKSTMAQTRLSRRLAAAKRSFVTRRVDLECVNGMSETIPIAGDICLARIDRLGHHSRLELPCGRRAYLYPGDEVLLAYGARYATDQFYSEVPDSFGSCQMVAAGGIASTMVSRHTKTRQPTQITPIGLLSDAQGRTINLNDFAIAQIQPMHRQRPHIVAVVGSGMNSGKTTTVAEVGRLALRGGLRLSGIKLTGTGSGGDLWKYLDSGINPVFDFTDGGYATTVGASTASLEILFDRLVNAASSRCDMIIVELADGLYQKETYGLLQSPSFRARIDSVLFAASNPMAGIAGVQALREIGLEPSALSGAVTESPLAAQELEALSDVEIFGLQRFIDDDNALSICMRSAHVFEEQHLAKSA
jgi:hypothetical protein